MNNSDRNHSMDAEPAHRLIQYIDAFVADVHACRSLSVQLSVDPYYYVQKTVELKLLAERITETTVRLDMLRQRLLDCHAAVAQQLEQDVRLISKLKETIDHDG